MDEDENLLGRLFDERLARQPEQVRRALEELDGNHRSFQLRVLRRSRAHPEPGDTFRLEPPLCPPLEGVVLNSHVTCMSARNVVVVLIFAPGVSPAAALSMGAPPRASWPPRGCSPTCTGGWATSSARATWRWTGPRSATGSTTTPPPTRPGPSGRCGTVKVDTLACR